MVPLWVVVSAGLICLVGRLAHREYNSFPLIEAAPLSENKIIFDTSIKTKYSPNQFISAQMREIKPFVMDKQSMRCIS